METSPDAPIGSTGDAGCIVLMLGYPGMGKRTVGAEVARQLGGVLVDNALINRPVLELFQWDGIEPLPAGVWDYIAPIRATVMRAIEDLAPATESFVFTNVLEDGPQGAAQYEAIRALATRRGSPFLAVMLTCDLDVQVSRIDTPDRVALRKGADPEGYRGYTLSTALYQPPATDVFSVDTSHESPSANAVRIVDELRARGWTGRHGSNRPAR